MRFIVPELAVSHFHLRSGDTVADFGAGAGFFEPALARAVGKEGRVYACEIQKPLIERIDALARTEHLDNVKAVWCDIESPGSLKLADGTLDAGVLANTLFQMENKAAALSEIARVLRTGGKLFVLDWTESFGGMGPQPGEVLTEDAAKALVEQYGFAFERSFPAGEHHYGLAFRKK